MAFSAIDMVSADTVTDLRAHSSNVAAACLLRGWSSPDDGGGGWFEWTSDTTVNDDGGTVLVPAEPRTGAWKRVARASEPLNPRWFGAKGDAITDDTAAFLAMIRVIKARQLGTAEGVYIGGGEVFIPRGNYLVSQSLAWPDHVTVRGEGWFSWITFTNVVDGVESFSGDGFLVCNTPDNNGSGVSSFSDLTLWCANKDNTGDFAGITMIGGAYCRFSRIYTAQWKTHYLLCQAENVLVEHPNLGGGGVESVGIRICSGVRGATRFGAANDITVIAPQFNGPGIAVSHEDGVCHRIIGGNYEGCQIARIKSGEAIEYINPCMGEPAPGDLFTVEYPATLPRQAACITLSIRGGFLSAGGAVLRMVGNAVLHNLVIDNALIESCDATGVIQGVNQNIASRVSIECGVLPAPLADGPLATTP